MFREWWFSEKPFTFIDVTCHPISEKTINPYSLQIQEMDRIFLAYLQNKNRAEGRRSYKAYLRHLGDVYKSCSDTEDPNCVASYTSRASPKAEPPKPAPVKTCDPTKDPYCMYMALVQGKSPYKPLVLPAATPAPQYVHSPTPAKDPQSGYYYYSPSTMPFLTMVCYVFFVHSIHVYLLYFN